MFRFQNHIIISRAVETNTKNTYTHTHKNDDDNDE